MRPTPPFTPECYEMINDDDYPEIDDEEQEIRGSDRSVVREAVPGDDRSSLGDDDRLIDEMISLLRHLGRSLTTMADVLERLDGEM